jgi:hypothetical protein
MNHLEGKKTNYHHRKEHRNDGAYDEESNFWPRGHIIGRRDHVSHSQGSLHTQSKPRLTISNTTKDAHQLILRKR